MSSRACNDETSNLPWRITHIGGLSTRSPTVILRIFFLKAKAQIAYLSLLGGVGHFSMVRNSSSFFKRDFGERRNVSGILREEKHGNQSEALAK